MANVTEFMKKCKEMISESQQELDEGIYEGDKDIFCFMKECYGCCEQLQAELASYKAGNVPVGQIASDNEGLANDDVITHWKPIILPSKETPT